MLLVDVGYGGFGVGGRCCGFGVGGWIWFGFGFGSGFVAVVGWVVGSFVVGGVGRDVLWRSCGYVGYFDWDCDVLFVVCLWVFVVMDGGIWWVGWSWCDFEGGEMKILVFFEEDLYVYIDG